MKFYQCMLSKKNNHRPQWIVMFIWFGPTFKKINIKYILIVIAYIAKCMWIIRPNIQRELFQSFISTIYTAFAATEY